MPGCGSKPDSSLGVAGPLPPSADIGAGGQSVGQATQFCLALLWPVGLPSWKMVPELQVGIIAISFYDSKKF